MSSSTEPMRAMYWVKADGAHEGDVLGEGGDVVGGGRDSFTMNTNPNSNDYSTASYDYPGSQNVCTGVTIRDIRLEYPSPFTGEGASRDNLDGNKESLSE